jgi:hypothetical protein
MIIDKNSSTLLYIIMIQEDSLCHYEKIFNLLNLLFSVDLFWGFCHKLKSH